MTSSATRMLTLMCVLVPLLAKGQPSAACTVTLAAEGTRLAGGFFLECQGFGDKVFMCFQTDIEFLIVWPVCGRSLVWQSLDAQPQRTC